MGAPEVVEAVADAPAVVADKAPEAPEALRTLSAEQILRADDRPPPERHAVPEWGGHVYIKIMSGGERDRFELVAEEGMRKKTQANIRASLLAATLCEEDGKRLFTNNMINQLGDKSSIPIDRLFDIAQKINKLNQKDVEELEKNS